LFEQCDPFSIVYFSEETLPMMLYSILTLVENRYCDGYHFALGQR
jgi:hypothetical protein